jgi:NAD(P)-dependent dehydrogenase (short-subunit alcohol dehydrogenase family)
MANDNETRIALVTGASRGLGREMALQLARSGRDVVLTYQSRAAEAQAVVDEIASMGRRAVALQLDTSQVAGFDAFVRRLDEALQAGWQRDRIDYLVNNAGIEAHSAFGQTPEEQFDRLMNVHFKGVYFLTQALLPKLADGGGIVLLSTGLARFAVPGYAAYASMKGGIEVLVKYLAKELGPRRIRANVVAPGAIETDFTRPGFEANPEIPKHLAAQTALGRVGRPGDIGGVVAFLCSDAAGWVNAQRLEASGGMFL